MTRRRVALALERYARSLVILVVAAAALAPRVAAAEPHKLLVLQSEGRAAPAIRAKIDAAITRLAITAEPTASLGELSFSDAATAVGCRPDAPSCKDDVLGLLAVDEIIITTVTPKPGGLEIAVQRVTRGAAPRDATMLLRTGTPPDKLDGIAPLFSEKPLLRPTPTLFGPPPAPGSSVPAGPPAPAGPAPAPFGPAPAPGPAPAAPVPAPTAISTQPTEPPPATAAPSDLPLFQPAPTTTPAPEPAPSDSHRKLALGGMIGGGSAILLGVWLWSAASSTQDEINASPTRTQTELNHLRDLESRGDFFATAGNVLVPAGAIVGAVATYFFLRDRDNASTATARVMPTLLPHGAGIVLSIGGAP